MQGLVGISKVEKSKQCATSSSTPAVNSISRTGVAFYKTLAFFGFIELNMLYLSIHMYIFFFTVHVFHLYIRVKSENKSN